MNSQLEPSPRNSNENPRPIGCRVAGDARQTDAGSSAARAPGAPESNPTQLSMLESENSSLRRLIVELLEKNQLLRDQLLAARDGNIGLGVEVKRQPRVDPQAA